MATVNNAFVQQTIVFTESPVSKETIRVLHVSRARV